MLCRSGQLRNISVFTPFIRFNSVATSSATNEYETVPEHIGENEEQNTTNEESTTKKPSFGPKCLRSARTEIR